jgi:hypothetical protein
MHSLRRRYAVRANRNQLTYNCGYDNLRALNMREDLYQSLHQRHAAKGRQKQRNPAMQDALRHASERAVRDDRLMIVYVRAGKPFRMWFVRPMGQERPRRSHLYRIV